MRKRMWINLLMVVLVASLFSTVSCTKRIVVSHAADQNIVSVDKTSGQILEEVSNEFGSQDVYFGFDSSELSSESRTLLKEKADWLKENPDVALNIEGNCDERGTIEYNIALGYRRADAVKAYLTDLGIYGPRLYVISYGEENPIDMGHNEDAWAKNRRVHLVVK